MDSIDRENTQVTTMKTTVQDIIASPASQIMATFSVSLNAAEAAKVYLMAIAHYGHGVQVAEAAADDCISCEQDYEGFGKVLGAIYGSRKYFALGA